MRINVVKAFLPPKKDYDAYLDKIWDNHWLTNNGPLLQELESELQKKLNSKNLLFVGNGTIALQIAIKALELKGEIITTPYSYCATTTSILWENCIPVFVDINDHDCNINASIIEDKITEKTSAILATHVYGNPCDVAEIEKIAKKHNLKVIYDAAHAFGVKIGDNSLLNYGDVSTCSFHATKVYHTTEGGAVITSIESVHKKMSLLRSFGHVNDDYLSIGINGKNSEFHAAMGLCNLKYVDELIDKRGELSALYDELLDFTKMRRPYSKVENLTYNNAYYPVIFKSNEDTANVISALNKENIFPRKYFYPSLNTLDYSGSKDSCPISEDIVHRVLSLPLYPDLEKEIVIKITKIVNQTLQN
ncbi:dTDP-4-amino-4,6-dideoxygalactose transaminase [Spirosomataceae bacterium TFI 002]|nr:dTDP-4-amino-4,6-dideoxygalactose transaminase [Spirosomataceae bacterium TFI 002]